MPDHMRNSQRDQIIANHDGVLVNRHAQAASEAGNRLLEEVQATLLDRARQTYHGGRAQVEGVGEAIQGGLNDAQRGLDQVSSAAQRGWNDFNNGMQHSIDQAVQNTQHGLTQLSHVPMDAVVRTTHGLVDNYQERERQIYPNEFNSRATNAPRHEGAQHRDVPPTQHQTAQQQSDARNQPTTHAEHPRAADGRPHDYVVRRGDSLSSIVRRDLASRHIAYNARQEHIIVERLADQHGHTILPGMTIHMDS